MPDNIINILKYDSVINLRNDYLTQDICTNNKFIENIIVAILYIFLHKNYTEQVFATSLNLQIDK